VGVRQERGILIILQKRVPGLTEQALERFVVRAKKMVGLKGAVSVLITSSREMRELNYRFRRKDEATDVLSFPALRGVVTRFAGDIAISAEIAAANAKRLEHSVSDEVKILALHGVLHLSGYDHERDDGQMARTEARLRTDMKLPVGLIERRGDQRSFDRKDRQDGKKSPAKRAVASARGRTPRNVVMRTANATIRARARAR
jgi:probable rRNA maturation factor